MAPSLSTLATVGFGIFCGSKLLGALLTFSKLLGKIDRKDAVLDISAAKTGIAVIDAFLKAVVPFFRLTIEDTPARLLWSMFAPAVTPFFFHVAIEGLKPGGSFILLSYPVFSILFQLIGIGFVTPTLWVTSLVANQPTGPLTDTPKTTLSLLTVMAAQSLILLPSFYGIDLLKEPFKGRAIAFFQIAPAVAWSCWASVHSMSDSNPVLTSLAPHLPKLVPNALPIMYYMLAGVSLYQHFLTVFEELVTGSTGDMLRLFSKTATHHHAGKTAGHFLAWDWLGTVVGVAWYVAMKAGKDGEFNWQTFRRVVGVGCLAGPGTAFAFEFANM
ncbi:hypothetical protein HDU93_002124 [Gonapodya sp. JEL0774]|nr:hypothetical protein HDU93_002124 [Gonapodya sp. JEL0774]